MISLYSTFYLFRIVANHSAFLVVIMYANILKVVLSHRGTQLCICFLAGGGWSVRGETDLLDHAMNHFHARDKAS